MLVYVNHATFLTLFGCKSKASSNNLVSLKLLPFSRSSHKDVLSMWDGIIQSPQPQSLLKYFTETPSNTVFSAVAKLLSFCGHH